MEPESIYGNELLSALVDAVKLEFTIRDMKSNPRVEDFSRFYGCESALEEKCRVISCMRETHLSRLKLYDYADCLMAWSEEVLNITGKYMDALAPKNPMDFYDFYQDTDAILSIEYFVFWIRHLEKRLAISRTYLEKVSRTDYQATLSTSAIDVDSSELGIGEGVRIAGNRKGSDTPKTDSTLEEGEIREQLPRISEDFSSECSELLRRVREFHDSYSSHKEPLTAVADVVKELSEKKSPEALLAIEDPEMLIAQVRTEAINVLCDQMPWRLDKFRLEVFFDALAHREDVYTNVWEVMQPILDITDSIYMRMHPAPRPATVQTD